MVSVKVYILRKKNMFSSHKQEQPNNKKEFISQVYQILENVKDFLGTIAQKDRLSGRGLSERS